MQQVGCLAITTTTCYTKYSNNTVLRNVLTVYSGAVPLFAFYNHPLVNRSYTEH